MKHVPLERQYVETKLAGLVPTQYTLFPAQPIAKPIPEKVYPSLPEFCLVRGAEIFVIGPEAKVELYSEPVRNDTTNRYELPDHNCVLTIENFKLTPVESEKLYGSFKDTKLGSKKKLTFMIHEEQEAPEVLCTLTQPIMTHWQAIKPRKKSDLHLSCTFTIRGNWKEQQEAMTLWQTETNNLKMY